MILWHSRISFLLLCHVFWFVCFCCFFLFLFLKSKLETPKVQKIPVVGMSRSIKMSWNQYSWSVMVFHSRLHAILHLPTVSLVNVGLLCRPIKHSVSGGKEQHGHFHEEWAEQSAEISEFRWSRILGELQGGWGDIKVWRQRAAEMCLH